VLRAPRPKVSITVTLLECQVKPGSKNMYRVSLSHVKQIPIIIATCFYFDKFWHLAILLNLYQWIKTLIPSLSGWGTARNCSLCILTSFSVVSYSSTLHLLNKFAKQMYSSAYAKCIPKHCLVPLEKGFKYLVSNFSPSGPTGGRPVTGSASQREGSKVCDEGKIVSLWCR